MAAKNTAKTDTTQLAPGFEESMAQLETLVSDMEDGNLSLEEALSAFETGIKLTRQCQQALQAAELKVQILSNPDGEPSAMIIDDNGQDEAEP
ncbi:MAG: exodeoxyribonuclease VII small subunit [Pseudohongiella sp.]|uniref:exodeoxyribonuclease VII small subunit n=1 Tax=Pseudohongiella sp. TaxID=1979412 RepID=UPI0034A08E5F